VTFLVATFLVFFFLVGAFFLLAVFLATFFRAGADAESALSGDVSSSPSSSSAMIYFVSRHAVEQIVEKIGPNGTKLPASCTPRLGKITPLNAPRVRTNK